MCCLNERIGKAGSYHLASGFMLIGINFRPAMLYSRSIGLHLINHQHSNLYRAVENVSCVFLQFFFSSPKTASGIKFQIVNSDHLSYPKSRSSEAQERTPSTPVFLNQVNCGHEARTFCVSSASSGKNNDVASSLLSTNDIDRVHLVAEIPPSHGQGWWHVPDDIQTSLQYPDDFESKIEERIRGTGLDLQLSALLLRVLVHESYYDLKMRQAQYCLFRSRDGLWLTGPTDTSYNGNIQKGNGNYYHGASTLEESDTNTDGRVRVTCLEAHSAVRSKLELVGDSILAFTTLLQLNRNHPTMSLGEITRLKSQLVSNRNLARVADMWGLAEIILMVPALTWPEGNPKIPVNSIAKLTVLSNTVEALIGAVHVEKGFKAASDFVVTKLLPMLYVDEDPEIQDPVSALQIYFQKRLKFIPKYSLASIDAKDTPYQVVTATVSIDDVMIATGFGPSLSMAKRDAALNALVALKAKDVEFYNTWLKLRSEVDE